jgi:hypothetical protein
MRIGGCYSIIYQIMKVIKPGTEQRGELIEGVRQVGIVIETKNSACNDNDTQKNPINGGISITASDAFLHNEYS